MSIYTQIKKERQKMKKLYRKIREWLSPQRYWYVAYMFRGDNKEDRGCASQYVSSSGPFNIEVVRKDLKEMNGFEKVIILNYKRISKNQYVE